MSESAAASPAPGLPAAAQGQTTQTSGQTQAPTQAPPPQQPPVSASKHFSPSIPVGLNEAGLDSPTFRAIAVHFSEQVDLIERWLEDSVRSTSKLTRDILALEDTINGYLSKIFPPVSVSADGVIDHDYTLLALRRASDGSREWLTQVMSTMRKLDTISVDPMRTFLSAELRAFKDVRRNLDASQKQFDQILSRYLGQPKSKEPSSLREDAFAVYEARKAYLAASMDFCQLAPQLRSALDKLLVRVSSDVWNEIRRSRDAATQSARWGPEMDRIRGWSREMEASENTFKRELLQARRDVGQSALHTLKPSRELEDYSASTVPFLGSRGPVNVQTQDSDAVISEKQGWLFLRTVSGKPARTTWIRRWFYCRDGIFGWLVQGPQGVLQGDEIGVLLCSAKPAVAEDRRFCFEIKTKSQTMVLQAETQSELTEWLEVFEVAKKRAFEASMGRDNSPVPSRQDPAFHITPPPAPELSAKSLEAQVAGEEPSSTPNLDRMSTLPVPGSESHLAARSSFDVSAAGASRRSITALGRDLSRDLVREEGESNREHAARIIQKLDLHRKTDGKSAGASSPSTGGIASLISAGHGLLPGYPGSMVPPGSSKTPQLSQFPSAVDTTTNTLLQGTLAPPTLAKAPAPTPLSRTAVFVTGDQGLSLDASSHMPAAVMANYWGSNPWCMLYGVDHGSPRTPGQIEENPFGMVVTEVGKPTAASEQVTSPNTHRKTVSVDTKPALMQPQVRQQQQLEIFPVGYPSDLRNQHPQFRLLFPKAPLDEKLVLVFGASWSSSTGNEGSSPSDNGALAGNGRIYVTPDNIYFYGHQMGLVSAYTMSLDIITEVTAAPGKDCDYIFLHLGEDANETGYTRVTIKVFLENLSLLHARLNLLIDDLQAEEPMTLPEMVQALIQLEYEEDAHRSPSVGSWEEIPSSTPIDDGTVSGRPARRRGHHHHHHHPHSFGSRLHLDRSALRPPPKFQLPTHPVVLEPEDMQRKVAERHFELSAKACFHVLFGDKSFVFPKLYFERRAQRIAQGPWILADQGRMRREFKFKVDYANLLGQSKTADVLDYQTIDVFQDHVSYVVTHVKTAWHLPHSQHLKLVVKIVITHAAKSKCKLAIYTRVDWAKAPAFSKKLVERQALDDAGGDAEELAEVATDQVRKLGPHSRTKRAIQVYGNIGQQTQVVLFSPAEAEGGAGRKQQMIKQRTLTTLLLETIRSFGESAVTSVIMWSFAAVRKFFAVMTAHRLLLLLLGLSSLTNLFWASKESSSWWSERRAVNFMKGVGVGPNMMMSRAVFLADLGEAVGDDGRAGVSWPGDSACFSTFQQVANSTDMNAPADIASSGFSSSTSRSVARRIRRTRQRLGTYRHDLLVAMRIVNRVEREMVQSEWENWLAEENGLCEQLRVVLEEEEGKEKEGKKEGGEGERRMKGGKGVREWYEGYCGSCRMDLQRLGREREGMGMGM